MKVLAAMSGGVDSAVAAARAVDTGHDVVGVHLALSRQPAAGRSGARGCCTVEDAGDARRSADILGIPFYVWDLAEVFTRHVVDDFVAEYSAGRTPNPCVRCNQRVKFSALLDRAVALGFDAVATGHYARLVPSEDEAGVDGAGVDGAGVDGAGVELHRAVDVAKDQSYVLAVVPPHRLRHALFPLGDAAGKNDVRAEAAARGLAVAQKPDSHDICFIPDGDTRGWLDRRVERRGGEVRDAEGTVVGHHGGAAGYTVGQRRGLRLGTPAPDGMPRYVLDVSVATNTVTVGPEADLLVREVTASAPIWLGGAPEPGARLDAQVRAHGRPVACVVRDHDSLGLTVLLDEPLRAVAPGQTLALYDGTRVVGSATVERTRRTTWAVNA